MKQIKNKPLFFQNSIPTVSYADGSKVEHQPLAEQSQLTNELFVIAQLNDGKKIIFNSRTISYKNEVFIAPLPNPVHLLINVGIENYNNSVITLGLFKNDCQLKENNKGVHLLNLGNDNTNQNFNNLIKFKITAVVSLITALEAFLNQVIPNDFIYKGFKKDKPYNFNKKQIESSSITFKVKLTDVMSQLIKKPHFSKQHSKIIAIIIQLYEIRRELIHMKTSSEDWLGLYFKITGGVIDIDLEKTIIALKKYMNLVQPNSLK
ncbi:MAG: hypothetical protein JJE55_07380 [Flavobacteriaceae bacterium]|nr:hypothetical protein [Flavobacteriaceae bacterium]